MDEVLLKNINDSVKITDTLYHLGDFAFGDIDNTIQYRDKINCKNIHLILGNHDKKIRKNQQLFNKVFSSISELKEVKINKQCITLCHYGMRVWNKSHYNSIMLYGHSHGMLPSIKGSFDVGVDSWYFQPLEFYQIQDNIQFIQERCD